MVHGFWLKNMLMMIFLGVSSGALAMESGLQPKEMKGEELAAVEGLKQEIARLWRKYGKPGRTLSAEEKMDAVEGYERLMGESKKLQQMIHERKMVQQQKIENKITDQYKAIVSEDLEEDFKRLDLVLSNAQKKRKDCSIV